MPASSRNSGHIINPIALRVIVLIQKIPADVLPRRAFAAAFIGSEEAIPDLEIRRVARAAVRLQR